LTNESVQAAVKLSQIYLYRAFHNIDCFKAECLSYLNNVIATFSRLKLGDNKALI